MQQYEIVPEMCYALLSFCRGPTLAPELDRRKTKKKKKAKSGAIWLKHCARTFTSLAHKVSVCRGLKICIECFQTCDVVMGTF